MATDPSPAMAPSVPEEERIQEDSIQASLARLQEMHVALRNLRDTIPRVVSSIQNADSTPEPTELYAQFSNAAAGAGRDIKGFMEMMGDERSKEVFEQVKKSRETDGEGIEGWRVTEHDDWLDVKEGKDERIEDVEEPEEQANGDQQEDHEKAVDKFKAAYPGIEVHLADIITVKLPPPVNINFSIANMNKTSRHQEDGLVTIEPGPEPTWKISGVTNSSMKETKLTQSILDAIRNSERKFNDLGSLLEMVASYTDFTTRPCTKCSRLIDRTGQLPIVRSRKRTKQTDGRYTTQWQALHKACI